MARKTIATRPAPAPLLPELEPTKTRGVRSRRVQLEVKKDHGPSWYTGATPWDDLSTAEQNAVREAAQNSVRFWESGRDII
jgi:hypothetical protein